MDKGSETQTYYVVFKDSIIDYPAPPPTPSPPSAPIKPTKAKGDPTFHVPTSVPDIGVWLENRACGSTKDKARAALIIVDDECARQGTRHDG